MRYTGQKHCYRVWFEGGGLRDVLATDPERAKRVAVWAEKLVTLGPSKKRVRASSVKDMGHRGTDDRERCPICKGHPVESHLFSGMA